MEPKSLIDIINYIVSQSVQLKTKYLGPQFLAIDYCGVFAKSSAEFAKLKTQSAEIGLVFKDHNGPVYKLKEPIKTGDLEFDVLRIRHPDPLVPQRGHVDFLVSDYPRVKRKYLKEYPQNFSLLKRPEHELLKLTDQDFNVLVFFTSSTPMKEDKLRIIVKEVVSMATELKNKYTDQAKAPVDLACIFSQSENEYQELTKVIKDLGPVVQETGSGNVYFLNDPWPTAAGPLRLVKIRKPDPQRRERGDADFNTAYDKFKKAYGPKDKFELIVRPDFEMLRLRDPNFKVMACFSSTPLTHRLNLNK